MRSTSRRNQLATVIVIAAVLLSGIVGFRIWVDTYFSPKSALEEAWSITIPTGLIVVEKHSEGSFHGDGYRLTVLRPSKNAQLEGSFFDVSQMSSTDLTQDELELVTDVNSLFQPKNHLDTQHSGLKKRLVALTGGEASYSDKLLSIYDEEVNQFYIYEWRI